MSVVLREQIRNDLTWLEDQVWLVHDPIEMVTKIRGVKAKY